MTDQALNLIAFGFWVSLFCAALGIAGLISDAARRRHERKRGPYDSELAETIDRDHDKAA